MLELIQNITSIFDSSSNLTESLKAAATKIKQEFDVDVCSIYLRNIEANELVLKASDGLRKQAVDTIRLRFNKGIVGLVAEREKPVNLANAKNHPRFHYFSEAGEENFNAFLGVPIIHNEIVIGVLVLQNLDSHRFNENTVSSLSSIAAHLANLIESS